MRSEGGRGRSSCLSQPKDTWLLPACESSVVNTCEGSWGLSGMTPATSRTAPRFKPHAGTAVCKAASSSLTVPKGAPSLLEAMKASGDIHPLAGASRDPGNHPDLPLWRSLCSHGNTSDTHASTTLTPRRKPIHLDFLPEGPCVLKGPLISISPKRQVRMFSNSPFTLPANRRDYSHSQEIGSNQGL